MLSEAVKSGEKMAAVQVEHLKMLEAMADLWPITLERKRCIQREEFSRIPELDAEQKNVVARIDGHLREVLKWRVLYTMICLRDPEFQKKEIEECKNDFVHWIRNWCFTLDPRLPPLGLPATIPLVLWPEQERILREVDCCYRNRMPVLIEKSRETGATWMFVAYGTHHFLFQNGFKLTLASRQEKLVDELKNPDALFSKVRFLLYKLPVFMRPKTFEKEDGANDNILRITNPDNESSITGEAGDYIGRGGRSSMTVIDEAAFLEHPGTVDSALSANTNCQLDVSTPNGMNHFYRKRSGKGVKVFTLRWYMDPSKNKEWRTGTKPVGNAWYEWMEERYEHDPTVVRQEIDIDYNASVAGVMIESKWVQAAVNFALEDGEDRSAGFDVAGGGKNKSVYIHRAGPVVKAPRVLHGSTSTECAWQALEFGEEDGVHRFNYDMDGIGEGVYGLYKSSERPIKFIVTGIRGGAAASTDLIDQEGRKGNEKFMNKRGELWWRVRERFRKTYEHVNKIHLYADYEMISIPDDPVLISELSAPKEKRTSSGKIGVESKEEMRRRGVDSPDHADALVYSFADETDSKHVIDRFNPTVAAGHVEDFDVEKYRGMGDQYVSIVQTPDFCTNALCCLWLNRDKQKLMVFGEISIQGAQPSEIIEEVNDLVDVSVKPIKEWIANDAMFNDLDRGKSPPWMLYKKAGVKLHRNYSDEYTGSIMLVNQMFEAGIIIVHNRCERLSHQLSTWSIKGGRPNDNFGVAMALCQIVTRLRRKKEIAPGRVADRSYNKGARFSSEAVDSPSVAGLVLAAMAKKEGVLA